MRIKAKIDRLYDQPDSNLLAFASVTLDEAFAVHGIRVVNGEKGVFAAMPSQSYQKNGETKYSDTFHPITAPARDTIQQAVVAAYQNALEQAQAAQFEVAPDVPQEHDLG
ncbi:MAG: SpoVG family protein [Oscillospiraceae bacterium]|nr:SpoVG family protein [Oscillospiraceae bacterium]